VRNARLVVSAFLLYSSASVFVALWFAVFLGLPHGLDARRTVLFAGTMCWPAVVCTSVGAVSAAVFPRSGRWVVMALALCCMLLVLVHEEVHGLSKGAGVLSLLAVGGGGIAGFRAAKRVSVAIVSERTTQ
jgi:hypothetical protein